MIILQHDSIHADSTNAPVTALNAVWYGALTRKMILPQLNHLFLVFPMDEMVVSCTGTTLDSHHYLLLNSQLSSSPIVVDNLHHDESHFLLLLISPDFVHEMATFLGVPASIGDLFHAVPMSQGDMISRLLEMLAQASRCDGDTEELFMEVIGQVLRLLRLRHQTLGSLSQHKQNTTDDLLPRLMHARQFIEANYLEPIKTEDVADYVALSEFHFARLFKAAFEVTVHQFVLRLRLNEARHLLESSQQSVTDVSLAVGYSSLSAFIRAFRLQFGMTPTTYRARFQQN